MVTNETQQAHGLLSAVKEKVPVDTIVEKITESRSLLIDIGLYGGIGLLSGFFIRKYSTLVMFAVLMMVGLYLLEHFLFITINWDVVYSTIGIQSSSIMTSDHIVHFIAEWVKANMIVAVSAVVGFLLGLRLG